MQARSRVSSLGLSVPHTSGSQASGFTGAPSSTHAEAGPFRGARHTCSAVRGRARCQRGRSMTTLNHTPGSPAIQFAQFGDTGLTLVLRQRLRMHSARDCANTAGASSTRSSRQQLRKHSARDCANTAGASSTRSSWHNTRTSPASTRCAMRASGTTGRGAKLQ